MAAALKVFSLPNGETSKQQTEAILSQISEWDISSLLDVFTRVFVLITIKLSDSVPVSADPVFKFIRGVDKWIGATRPRHGVSNEETARMAERMLGLPKGLSGPERSLVAAVKLFHRGEPEANARSINTSNDELKAAFIANISTAINSNLRDGLLEEISTEGHSTYRVTPQGFAFFDFLYRKLQVHFDKQQPGDEPARATDAA